MGTESRLHEIGVKLPPPQSPIASYVPAVSVGNLLFLSGTGPILDGQPTIKGRLGVDLTVDEGYHAAHQVMLHLLSTIRHHLGTLDRVERIVKVLGFVASASDFVEQPAVLNGASDLLIQVFGDRGRHARAAIGTSVLPLGIPVEIEMIVEFR